MQVVRTKCKTCSRSFQPEELLAFLCPYCLEERGRKFREQFGPSFDTKSRACDECNEPLYIGGYVHWDRTANTFALLCVPCSEKAITKAAQYRGTPFAHMQKAQ